MPASLLYERLKDRFHDVVPDAELRNKADLADGISRLKAERDAVILGHNYMEPALYYSIADYTGDSLELSRRAARTDKSVIVFCGVRFMAETAKILNPAKTVLIPSERAGCSLAASITAAAVRRLRERFPGVPIIAYVNTYADVKAEVDVCCTSSNEYLARNVARETGRRMIIARPGGAALPVPGDEAEPEDAGQGAAANAPLFGWGGRCEAREKLTVGDILDVRRQFPDAVVLAHPECRPESSPRQISPAA